MTSRVGCDSVDGHLENLLAWFLVNKGKVLGTGAGILVGWLTIKYGFLKAVFVLLCIVIGCGVGAYIDERGDIRGLWEGRFPSKRR
ncbi:MAG: DUF2273 domain-containing protein [Firmicutes bacterium]|nr:DUF2273 domain-containing protein [Bacillota bacterium]